MEILRAKKPSAGKQKEKKKPKPDEKPPTDPFEHIILSRKNEREEMWKMCAQLDKLRLETMRTIQASRTKFHLARWKMIHKSMDD